MNCYIRTNMEISIQEYENYTQLVYCTKIIFKSKYTLIN